MSQQGLRQKSARAISGSAGSYNDDFMSMFTAEGVPVAGTFNERFLRWLNIRLSRTYTNLPEAMQAFAVSVGASSWNGVGTFAAVVPPGPVNTVAPVVSGTLNVGQTLSCTTGTWTGTGTITYAYQWVNSVSGNIGGATSSTYLLQATDETDNISCVVTATDDNGPTSQASNVVGPIVAAAKTYAEFQAHIATLTATTRAVNSTSNMVGQFRVTLGSPSGGLIGSSWGPGSPGGFAQGASSALGRIIQHAMPSEAVFNALVASTSEVCMTIITVSTPAGALNAVTRNGYPSTSYAGGAGTANAVSELLLFDPTDGPVRMVPNAGTGPTPYTW